MTARQRLAQLVLLSLMIWSAAYARFAPSAVQESLQSDLGLSDTDVALAIGAGVALPMALVSMPLGALLNRASPAIWFLGFALLNLVALAATALAPSFYALLAARILVGLAMAAILIAAYAYIGSLYPEGQRGRGTMVVAIGEIAGAPAAFAVGGALLLFASGGPTFGYAPWREALLWMAVPLLLMAPVALLVRKAIGLARPGAAQSLRALLPGLWAVRSVIVPLMTARILLWIADGAVLVWGVPALVRGHGLSAAEAGGLIGAIFLVAGLVGPAMGGFVADLCYRVGGPRRTIVVMGILTALSVPVSLFGLMPTVLLTCIGIGLFMLAGITLNIMAMSLTIVVVPEELRGVMIGMTSLLGGLFCFGLAPLAIGLISDRIGGPQSVGIALAIVCSIMSAICVGVFLVNRSRYDGQGEAAAAQPAFGPQAAGA